MLRGSWRSHFRIPGCAGLFRSNLKSTSGSELQYISGVSSEMKIIKLFLEKSPILEKMLLKPHHMAPDTDDKVKRCASSSFTQSSKSFMKIQLRVRGG